MDKMVFQYYIIKMIYFCKNSGTIDLWHDCFNSIFERMLLIYEVKLYIDNAVEREENRNLNGGIKHG